MSVKVLLTGANGFIGSHILDGLVGAGLDVAILLRTTGNTEFINGLLPEVEVRHGALGSPVSLREAVKEADVVIHCAGKTKALRKREYHEVNVEGTRNLVKACNESGSDLRRLILISSLSVSGPGTPDAPACEDDPPRPVSLYGQSKMLGEQCVRQECRVPFTILRPAAVYGPRDRDFFTAFRLARRRFVPLIGGGKQQISLVYVADVVKGVVRAVRSGAGAGGTYHLAHPDAVSQKEIMLAIAGSMGRSPVFVPVPALAMYPLGLLADLTSRLTSRPNILSLEKAPELTAGGWVCSTQKAGDEIGFHAEVPLSEGVRLALEWYRKSGWL